MSRDSKGTGDFLNGWDLPAAGEFSDDGIALFLEPPNIARQRIDTAKIIQ